MSHYRNMPICRIQIYRMLVLEKSDSAWDDGHMTEWFNIENATLADTLSALGIKTKNGSIMAAVWIGAGVY